LERERDIGQCFGSKEIRDRFYKKIKILFYISGYLGVK
jgi:hypothetical protein